MSCDIQSDLMRADKRRVLGLLLQDKTSKRNILWGTDMYAERGTAYAHDSEITPELITGVHAGLIRSRAQKHQDQQSERTRTHAEVFTPMWVCAMMIDALDGDWFGAQHVFTDESGHRTQRVAFPEGKTWQDYVCSTRMEITCGEAPFLVSRYDAATGEPVPVENRIGILDRKLRVVDENAADEDEWMHWAILAFRSTYGYEFQGDNLLIARLNLLATFEEYLDYWWHREATDAELRKIANIIVWNIWQMDGLNNCVPYSISDGPISLFESQGLDDPMRLVPKNQHPYRCRVYRWRSNNSQVLVSPEGSIAMKFDYIIGNPPFQEDGEGNNKAYAKPIYDLFLDASYKLGNVAEMIHPARFLFNAGSTPKAWNEKMLQDPHVKVLWYEADSKAVFPSAELPGGVAITYRDATKNYGPIMVFTTFPQLNDILHRVINVGCKNYVNEIAFTRTAYKLTDAMHRDYPNAIHQLSRGHAHDMSTNIFDRLPEIFHDEPLNDGHEYARILGRTGGCRIYRYIRRDYINNVANFNKYKVILSKADGAAGTIGKPIPARILGNPSIEGPGVGLTESFLSIGFFDSEDEARIFAKYYKTKFFRTLVSVLKTTQDITPEKFKFVPLQDFTSASDIDWTRSIADIDKQLYKKYNLTDDEIDFIETNVKEMK